MEGSTLGNVMLGIPRQHISLGVSLKYFDGGKFNLFDGTTSREVKAQRDYLVEMGAATTKGKIRWGATGKFLSSEVIEWEPASPSANLILIMPSNCSTPSTTTTTSASPPAGAALQSHCRHPGEGPSSRRMPGSRLSTSF